MAEMNVYHASKVEDLKAIAINHLDGEIAFYEQVKWIYFDKITLYRSLALRSFLGWKLLVECTMDHNTKNLVIVLGYPLSTKKTFPQTFQKSQAWIPDRSPNRVPMYMTRHQWDL